MPDQPTPADATQVAEQVYAAYMAWMKNWRLDPHTMGDTMGERKKLLNLITTALTEAEAWVWEEAALIAEQFTQPCAHTACICSDAILDDGKRIADAMRRRATLRRER